MAERVELLNQVDVIATTLAENEDPVTWPCWMSYILEAMEDKGNGEVLCLSEAVEVCNHKQARHGGMVAAGRERPGKEAYYG